MNLRMTSTCSSGTSTHTRGWVTTVEQFTKAHNVKEQFYCASHVHVGKCFMKQHFVFSLHILIYKIQNHQGGGAQQQSSEPRPHADFQGVREIPKNCEVDD